MKRIALLGSTGSIGRQTLDVVRWHRDRFEVVALVANRPSELFAEQVHHFRPRLAWLTAEEGGFEPDVPGVEVRRGLADLRDLAAAAEADLLVVASSGTVGFLPTLAALERGVPVALANKETLIMAGHLVTEAARKSGAPLLPIDSEHSALWQCLLGEQPFGERVRRLVLTASGGAFRDWPADELAHVTPAQALKHPTWSMGPKITVDSATLMNKGLEVIEAHWLFDLPFDRVDVVIHHQSIVHSLVEFVDGSVKAQLGLPDMRLPIQFAMTFPERHAAPVASLDLTALGSLTFAHVDERKYPGLALAYAAGYEGGTAPTVLNAANEVAVARFLAEEIGYLDITAVVGDTLEAHHVEANPSLEAVQAADEWARRYARTWRA